MFVIDMQNLVGHPVCIHLASNDCIYKNDDNYVDAVNTTINFQENTDKAVDGKFPLLHAQP